MNLPTVSVIVLNYDGLKHLEACFESLLALDYPSERLELILADNASADASREFVSGRFPGIRIIPMPLNYGFSRANNLAASQAKGEYVAFLNNDMRVEPDWLSELVKPALAEDDVVAVGSRILSWDGKRIDFAGSMHNFYGHGWQTGFGDERIGDYEGDREILAPCGGAMLINRQVFLDVGGFDEDFFAYFEDSDLGWRLWVMGYRAMMAGRSISYHVHHGYWGQVGQERKLVLFERNALYSVIKNYDDENMARILPVALLLLLERAYLNARPGFRPEAFRVNHRSAKPTSSEVESAYTAGYYWREVWRTLRQDGASALYTKARDEMGRRGWVRRLLPRFPHRRSDEWVEVPSTAYSLLVAGSDVARFFPIMLAKRQQVQASRRRPDEEIVRLFQIPYRPNFADADYERVQRRLANLYDLDELFGPFS